MSRLDATRSSSQTNCPCAISETFGAAASAPSTIGHEAREGVRHLDAGKALALHGVVYHDREVEAEVGDVREGVRRVEGQRRQYREDLFGEEAAQALSLRWVEVAAGADHDAGFAELRQQVLAPQVLHRRELVAQDLADRGELLRRAHAVRRDLDHAAGRLVAQAGDAHHEELVEVVGVNREETHALEQRQRLVARFVQHAVVELEPAQLLVDVETRIVEVGNWCR